MDNWVLLSSSTKRYVWVSYSISKQRWLHVPPAFNNEPIKKYTKISCLKRHRNHQKQFTVDLFLKFIMKKILLTVTLSKPRENTYRPRAAHIPKSRLCNECLVFSGNRHLNCGVFRIMNNSLSSYADDILRDLLRV